MAFFDELSRKASAATAKAMQKAQEVSETVKLNSLITEEERKIEGLYSQIGKLYMSVHRDDCEEQFAGMVGAVKSSEDAISKYQDQIQALKNMQRCEKCGAEISGDSLFCTSCGAPLQKQIDEPETADGPRCSHCGAVVTSEMLFCTSCGHPLGTSPVQGEAAVEIVGGKIEAEQPSGGDSSQADDVPVRRDPPPADVLPQETIPDAKQINPDAGQTGEADFATNEIKADAPVMSAQILEPEPPVDKSDKSALEVVSVQQSDLPSEAPEEAETPHKVCPNCGASLDDDQLFCYECGAKL